MAKIKQGPATCLRCRAAGAPPEVGPVSRPRVLIRLPHGWTGDLPPIYADDGVAVYVVDEGAPEDRIYEMAGGASAAINAILLGGEPPAPRPPRLRLVRPGEP